MVNGECEIEKVTGRIASNTILSDGTKSRDTGKIAISESSIKHFENFTEKKESKRQSVEPIELPVPMEDTTNKSQFAVQPSEMSVHTEVRNKSSSSLQSLEVSDVIVSKTISTGQLLDDSPTVSDPLRKSLPNHLTVNKNLISGMIKDRPTMLKDRSPAKSSRSSSSIKKVRCRSNPVSGSKLQVLENKPKKMLEGAANNRPRGAEDKLNELLDIDGGISKRKDATLYLKLLIVTASSGDDNGEAVQSTRNLSIILDALLKTKKRNVLNDVISKNGLQMLHNILKQNRTNHKRIPIIRKLLKILEYLAEKEILTVDLINSGPPCLGVESFRESIMKLTRHDDMQVHRIARQFRNKWMPHPLRRNNYSDRDGTNLEQQPDLLCNRFSTHKQWCGNSSRHIADNASMNQTSIGANSLCASMQRDSVGPSINNHPVNRSRMRKRKSRWDHPEEGNFSAQTFELVEDHKAKRTLAPSLQQSDMREAVEEPVDDVKDEIVFHGCDQNISKQCERGSNNDAMQQIHDDAPPGFPSLPLVSHDAFSTATENLSSDIYHRNCSCELVTGCPQERFLSHIPVSYGIPLFFVDQLGTPQAESVDSWKISVGIPFHPFPPLPSYPREPPSCTSTRTEHGESQRDHQRDVSSTPCTSGAMSPEVANTGAYNQHRMRSSPGNLGRRYFRQQKWTNSNRPPCPWVRNRNGRGFKENNSRSGTQSLGVGNSENESGNVCYSVGVNGESENITVYQNSQHHYDH
ncbi:hypothetical protein AQUCO_08200017v1 [Aquilegia coerulea]|uniref:Uncharacterized protein n=2 Tax=Aquilegia coerulea TaxID=218851 RepID=A0A2G5C7D2_AQUCA|nr:hypothetical protein AQUCO_08200017v1 [Aquilegia coerulea]